jgi:hypothetical protein
MRDIFFADFFSGKDYVDGFSRFTLSAIEKHVNSRRVAVNEANGRKSCDALGKVFASHHQIDVGRVPAAAGSIRDTHAATAFPPMTA